VDLNALAALVVEKFKDANGYSELSDEQLHKSVHLYLDSIYRKYFAVAQKKIAEKERAGLFPNSADYKKEYDLVEDLVMIYANKIAAVSKSEV
jgi:hypothetical protein